MSTENLAARLRLMSEGAIRLSSKALNKAADELDRLTAALAEHMQLTREAVEQCDVLRARIAELERQPIRWLPIEEAPKDKDVFLWSRHLGDAFSGSWHSKFGWVDSQYNKLPNVTHFAEIVGPDGER